MQLINLGGRIHLALNAHAADIADASRGQLSSAPADFYDQWGHFLKWAADAGPDIGFPLKYRTAELGAPSPRPRQVFAIGLNYREHADESGFDEPDEPVVFTKFVSSFTGPDTTVQLPPGSVDWEAELVAVIGFGGRDIRAADAWQHVAGICLGQDLSERQAQHSGPAPQFSLAKSHRGFSPMGPALLTVDEFTDIDDLEISTQIDGEYVQRARTSQMIFPVPLLIERISSVVELYPGDVIYTGTPSGVGVGRTPPRFLRPGNTLVSHLEGVGTLTQRFE
jgi:2,4-didehydro-3-deoxy-L-rhamnonate hydrolase